MARAVQQFSLLNRMRELKVSHSIVLEAKDLTKTHRAISSNASYLKIKTVAVSFYGLNPSTMETAKFIRVTRIE